MEVFSHSRLSKYESCPAAFYRHYVLEAPEVPSEPLVLGKACHTVIETAMRLGQKDENFFRLMSKAVLDTAPIPIEPEEVFSLTCNDSVLREFHPGNKIEEHLLASLSDEPFAPQVQGYIDLWRDENCVQLVDWKTNRKAYTPTDTKQLGLYAWYLSKLTGKAVRGKLVFLRLNEAIEHQFSCRDMEDAREWALTLALEIQKKLYKVSKGEDCQGLFPATPGDPCRYCGFAFECVNGELPVPGEIKSYDEAVKLGAEVLRLEAALNQMKGYLKGYVEACGPVVVGGRKFLIAPTNYWDWSSEAVQAVIKKIEEGKKDPYSFLKPDSYQMKKLKWDEKYYEILGAVRKTKYAFKHVSAN
ncbi:MAG: PD-(D/E)XK nuclease superfamily protein [Pelotomaculum sp. PtaB.Bin104]|nr:MAG: PD-(D/E)XK nuclease superfamily protein [Pelotomaculum sp. PtaB.Bin104]